MKTRNDMTQRVLAAMLFSCAIAVSALTAETPRFRPVSDVEPAIGRYLVALTMDDAVEGGMTSDLLARTYGGRLEPFAYDGLAGPMLVMVMRPAQARALSNDPRVLWVEERPATSEQLGPAPVAPTPVSPVVSSGAAARTPRSNWEVTANSWSSGTYDYDGAGNVERIGDDLYRYDRFGRLARATAGTAPLAPSATTPANEQNFGYDIHGNLTSLNTQTATETMTSGFAVDAQTNQLNGVCPGGVDRCLMGVYDPAGSGNQLGLSQSGEYTWDALGMITELRSSRYERYVYDANDERILVIDTLLSTETARRYALRGPDSKVLRELTHTLSTNSWSAAKDYVYRGGSLIASFSNASAQDPDRHFHTDHLGSTRLVTDGSGRRLATHTYWPFGREADGSESDAERMKFTGHERDGAGHPSGFELDYMHARYYDANLGRFLSVDPKERRDARDQPQRWNRYTYARNNPILLIDPDGQDERVGWWYRRFGAAGRHIENAAAAMQRFPILNLSLRPWGSKTTVRAGPMAVNLGADVRVKMDANGNTKLTAQAGAWATSATAQAGPVFSGSLALSSNGELLPDGLKTERSGSLGVRSLDSASSGKMNAEQVTMTINAGFLGIELGINYGAVREVVDEARAAADEAVNEIGQAARTAVVCASNTQCGQ